jgi:hypothetical protein
MVDSNEGNCGQYMSKRFKGTENSDKSLQCAINLQVFLVSDEVPNVALQLLLVYRLAIASVIDGYPRSSSIWSHPLTQNSDNDILFLGSGPLLDAPLFELVFVLIGSGR